METRANGIGVSLMIRGRVDEVSLGEEEVREEPASDIRELLDEAPHVHGGEGPIMRSRGAMAVAPIVSSGRTSNEVASTGQERRGILPKDHISAGVEPTVEDAVEDILSARIENLTRTDVAESDSAVLRISPTLRADPAVEEVMARGVHAGGREGARPRLT